MQVRCIKAHGLDVPGDVVEVPDGSAVDPEHYAVLDVPPPAPEAPAGVSALAALIPSGEGM